MIIEICNNKKKKEKKRRGKGGERKKEKKKKSTREDLPSPREEGLPQGGGHNV